jgi:ATP-dependent RNA helicase DDX31/DBP7
MPGFELNIVTAAPPPKLKPAPSSAPDSAVSTRPPQQIEQQVAVAQVSAAAPAAPKVTKRKASAAIDPEPAGGEPSASSAAATTVIESVIRKPPAKKARYASAPASATAVVVRKADPTRAAALPDTLASDAKVHAATFSATTFLELPLDRYLQRHLTERMQMARLTPVQQHSIPALLGGGDLLVRSPTGSGKTLAYAVPIVQSLVSRGATIVTRAAGTFAIVLVPTRELCLQTHDVVRTLTTPFPWLVTSTLMGGENRKAEKARLRKGVALLVGTPGRIADHAQTTAAWNFSLCAHLVLDEADRLLDLGFQHSIDTILQKVEAQRDAAVGRYQAVLLSATLTKGLRELAGRSLRDYATLTLNKEGARFVTEGGFEEGFGAASSDATGAGTSTAAATAVAPATTVGCTAAAAATDAAVSGSSAASAGTEALDAPLGLVQSYAFVPTRQRLTALLALLHSKCVPAQQPGGRACKMIVFVSSCDGVDFLYELLAAAGRWPDLREAAIKAGHANEHDELNGGNGIYYGRSNADDVGPVADEDDEDEEDEEDEGDWEEGSDGGFHLVAKPRGRKRGRGSGGVAGGAGDKSAADPHSFACALLAQTVVVRLHGKMKQKDRTQAFHRFRDLSSGVMICTDVAARGLNLQGVHWIVQHDLPQDAKEYLHRAGRTARLGQGGQAVLLLHPCEAAFLQLLRQAGVHPRELQFASLQAALCPEGSRRDVFVLEVALQKQLEEAVKERAFLEHAAIGAYQSYLRAYAAHSKVVQRLVHVGGLHLGHLAKSFGLKDVPSTLAAQQHKRAATARAPATGYAGAGAQATRKKKLSLQERMRRQPAKGGAVGSSFKMSEFAAAM